MENCLFCRIARGEIPSRKVYEDDQVIAFGAAGPVQASAAPSPLPEKAVASAA